MQIKRILLSSTFNFYENFSTRNCTYIRTGSGMTNKTITIAKSEVKAFLLELSGNFLKDWKFLNAVRRT